MYDELYCKVYINTDNTRDELSVIISRYLNTNVNKFYYINGKTFESNILENKDYKTDNILDDFLYYKFIIEIEPIEESNENEYISEIGNLLEYLWSNKFKAIASCDFEEDLPNKGGYISLN